jgi:hypothetical protein
MNQYELLQGMAKAGFTFGRDDDGTYLQHDGIYDALEKWTSALWGERLYYKFHLEGMPHITLDVPGFEESHQVYLEDDGLDIDRLISSTFHLYSWIP